VSDSRFQSTSLPQAIAIRITSAAILDDDRGVILLITLNNRSHSSIFFSNLPEFSNISYHVYQKLANGYILVEPRTKPDLPDYGGSHSIQFIRPSEIVSWMVPMGRYYDLKPGFYRVDIAVSVSIWPSGQFPPMLPTRLNTNENVASHGLTFPVSITTGPIDFNIP
jgi:hypothetical protein